MRTRTLLLAGLVGVVAALAPRPVQAQSLDVKEKILSNGMRVLVVERERVPRVFCSVFVGTGAVQEKTGRTGLAHLLEHMLFKGTHTMGVTDLPADQQFVAEADRTMLEAYALQAKRRGLQRQGRDLAPDDAAMLKELVAQHSAIAKSQKQVLKSEALWGLYQAHGGSGLNASTGHDSTQYFVELPSNKLELFFWLESDRFRDPVFREYYAEIDVVKEERRMRTESTPTGMINEEFEAMYWAGHPYGRPVIGWMADLGVVTRQDMADYYWKHYTAENMTAIFVGAAKAEQVFALAETYFGTIRQGTGREDVIIPGPNPTGIKRLEAEADAPTSIEIRWPACELFHPDQYALDYLAEMLRGRAGRLRAAMVEERKLALNVGARHSNSRFGGSFSLTARPRDGVPIAEVEAALLAAVEDLKTNPPSEDEWERITTQVESGLVGNFSTNRGVAFTLGSCAVMGDWTEATRQFAQYRQVTPADLPKMAAKYLDLKKRATLLITRKEADPAAAPEDPQARLVTAITGAFGQLRLKWKDIPAEARPGVFAQFTGMISKVTDPEMRAEFEAKLAEFKEKQ